jgi:hypothetical protein
VVCHTAGGKFDDVFRKKLREGDRKRERGEWEGEEGGMTWGGGMMWEHGDFDPRFGLGGGEVGCAHEI